MITVLFIGDICGKLGREAVRKCLPVLKEKYNIDFIIANGENATHGRGINYEHYQQLMSYGINCITMGNHYFGVDELIRLNDKFPNVLKPLNMADKVLGCGTKKYIVKGKTIQVTNLLGISEMQMLGQNNPFTTIEKLLEEDNSSDIHIIDFHAEATGEKGALARFVDGKVSMVVGTHTHVQTADSRILPLQTGFITDVGSCCAYQSVLGMNSEEVIQRNAYGIPRRFYTPNTGQQQFNAALITFGDDDKVKSIKTIFEVLD